MVVAELVLVVIHDDPLIIIKHKPIKTCCKSNFLIIIFNTKANNNAPDHIVCDSNRPQITQTISSEQFDWKIPIYKFASSHEKQINVSFITDKSFVPSKIYPTSGDTRELAVGVKSIKLINLPAEDTILPMENTKQQCSLHKNQMLCSFNITNTQLIQLPTFYYPHLLNIKVNDNFVNYFQTQYKNSVLAGIKLLPGHYEIKIAFVGIRWANYLSLLAWICLIFVYFRPLLSFKTQPKVTLLLQKE